MSKSLSIQFFRKTTNLVSLAMRLLDSGSSESASRRGVRDFNLAGTGSASRWMAPGEVCFLADDSKNICTSSREFVYWC